MRTIVGDTAFERARSNVDQNINIEDKHLAIELGTMEELMQDSFIGFRKKTESRLEEIHTFI